MTAPEPRRLLVLDLDGTLCLGDAPVRAYARAVSDLLPPGAGADLVARLEAFLAGSGVHDGAGRDGAGRDGSGRDGSGRDGAGRDDFDPAAGPMAGAADGYQAVAAAATATGLPLASLGEAYRVSRDLDAWLDAVRPPTGMRAVLAEAIAAGVRPALVTNAGGGIPRLLAALGLADVVPVVVTDAGKPERMPEHLDLLLAGLASGPADPARRIAGLGDIWANDLAEIAERGGSTFLIDRHRVGHGTPTASAAEPEGLLDALRGWIADGV